MATMSNMIGTGLTVAYAVNSAEKFEAQVLGLTWSGGDVEVLETTHMGSTYPTRTFRGGFIDWGTIVIRCFFDNKATAANTTLLTVTDRQYTTGTLTITMPDPDGAASVTAGTWVFTAGAFCINAQTNVNVREFADITYTFKLTAAPTITASA